MPKTRNKVVLFTLNPVFPKSCPGCGVPADSMGTVPVTVTNNLKIPMCSRCAKYTWSVMIPLYTLLFVSGLALSLIFYLAVIEPLGSTNSPIGLFFLALGLVLFWALVFIAAYIFLFNNRPAFVIYSSRTHSPFSFAIVSRNSLWAEQLENLNKTSVLDKTIAVCDHEHHAEDSGKTEAQNQSASVSLEQKQRQRIKLLDLAVELYIKAVGDDQHIKAKERLAAEFPLFAPAEIDLLWSKAGHLLWLCYDFAEKSRDEKIGYDEGILEIQYKCPGFSETAFEKALANAFFSSR